MNKSTVAAAAAGSVLAVVGAVSGLFLTIGSVSSAGVATSPPVVTEYVDSSGNPIDPPTAVPAAAPVIEMADSNDEGDRNGGPEQHEPDDSYEDDDHDDPYEDHDDYEGVDDD